MQLNRLSLCKTRKAKSCNSQIFLNYAKIILIIKIK